MAESTANAVASVAEIDALMATAAGHASRALELLAEELDEQLLERDVKVAMTTALQAQGAQVFHESRYRLPRWEPQPGGVDISVRLEDRRKALAELKWANGNGILEALWDAVKLAAATELPEIASVYLCYGASEAGWEKPVECAEVFDSGTCGIVDLIRQHQDSWDRHILGGSTGRPTSAQEALEVWRISDIALNVGGEPWRLRTIRLEPTGLVVDFADGRPA
jgi:hypothetical protein